jgi:hypothetical protein
MQKSTTFNTILCVKKCHFHYDKQKMFVAFFDISIISQECFNVMPFLTTPSNIRKCCKHFCSR